MAETKKCPLCDEEYEIGTNHECGDRQKLAKEHSKMGDGSGHVDD